MNLLSVTLALGRAQLKVDVQYEPQIHAPEVLTVTEGDQLSLKCDVDANPAPTLVSWDGPGGNSASSILDIFRVKKSDRGNYTCVARNVLNLYGIGSVSKENEARTEVKVIL